MILHKTAIATQFTDTFPFGIRFSVGKMVQYDFIEWELMHMEEFEWGWGET